MSGITRRVVLYEALGFVLILIFIWTDETLDLPHLVWGAGATPLNWAELIQETVVIVLFGVFVLSANLRFLRRIRYLEGFIRVCSWCRRAELDGQWVPLESFVHRKAAVDITHGLCPDCLEENYAEFYDKKAGRNE